MNILDSPSEILCDIFKSFDSLYTFKALSQTCTRFKYLLSELIVVIDNDQEVSEDTKRPSELDNLTHVCISNLSEEGFNALRKKYSYFIFNISTDPQRENNLHNQISIMKLMLRTLQFFKVYHTVYVNSKNFNKSPLIRFLLPKLNSQYTEFYFPLVKKIEAYEDLRLLDNTNCYFSKLKQLTIGSLSFQLFNLKAPRLEKFNHGDVILTRTFINENVSTSRISYSKFFNSLMCPNLKYLEVIGSVAHCSLYKFKTIKTLKIYADNTTTSFDLGKFENLEELVISKCSRLKYLENLSNTSERLKFLNLSNNKSFDQHIVGNFENLRNINLSNTAIHESPGLQSNLRIEVNVQGCKNLVECSV